VTDSPTDFHNPHGSTQGLLNAIQSVGGLVSLILAPYCADYAGRKPCIFLGCSIVVIAGVVQCLSVNIQMFTAARFLSTQRSTSLLWVG